MGFDFEKLKLKYVDFLESICLIETPTANKERIDKMVDFIEGFAENEGYLVKRIPFEKAGDCLLITLEGDNSKSPALLMAHMDTVHPVGLFGEGDFIKIKDDIIYGPGVQDCKGGIATALYCLERLKHEENLRPVKLLLTSDEEVSAAFSGKEGVDLIKNTAKDCCAVLNLEAGGKQTVTVCRKGILKMQVEVSGIAAHAGNAYFDGASAIKDAAHAILEIESLSENGGITYNCGVISGGTTINTVPASCVFKLDIRISTIDEMNFAEQKIHEICAKSAVLGTTRKATVLTKRPPMEKTSKNLELLELWNACAKRVGAGEFKGATKGGGSDAAYSTMLGVPTLCSCAMEGFDAHAITEHADLSTFKTRADIICEVIKSL